MRIIKDNAYYRFATDVLKALHLDSKVFFDDVENQNLYEVQIFNWINELYLQGKNSDEAIQDIHQKRWDILAAINISPKP